MIHAQLLLRLLGITAVLFNRVEARLEGEGIVGGDGAAEGQFPYQVSLERGGKSICGGSILSEYYVLTAAHCVVGEDNYFVSDPLTVIAGTADLKSRSNSLVAVGVVQVFVPTEYDAREETTTSRATGDIAILKLATGLYLKGNSNLGRVQLPKKDETYEGVLANVSGFGWNNVDVGTDLGTGGFVEIEGYATGRMRFAKANVLSYDDCQNIYGAILPIMKTHLCAAVVQRNEDESEGVCSGDSGGPLVYGGVQIGVVSVNSLGCSEEYLPTIYTRVSDYLDFMWKVGRGKIDKSIRTTILRVLPEWSG